MSTSSISGTFRTDASEPCIAPGALPESSGPTNNIPVIISDPICADCEGELEAQTGGNGTLDLTYVNASQTQYTGNMKVYVTVSGNEELAYDRNVSLSHNVTKTFLIPEGTTWTWDQVTRATVELDPSS